jgi:membrane protein implicated in regulation of membrane protease activity
MNWSDVYLFCFLVGFSLSVLSFLAGAAHIHLSFRLHLPFHSAAHGAPGHAAGHSHAGGTHISWFNASTAMAFLAWFGGTGYMLTRYSHVMAFTGLAFSTLAGLVAGWIVFRFMLKLMNSADSQPSNEDYRIEGTIGKINMPIRANGTGEVIFSRAGARHCAGARTEGGQALEKGAEVVIERYEKGIAYVKRWEEFTK